MDIVHIAPGLRWFDFQVIGNCSFRPHSNEPALCAVRQVILNDKMKMCAPRPYPARHPRVPRGQHKITFNLYGGPVKLQFSSPQQQASSLRGTPSHSIRENEDVSAMPLSCTASPRASNTVRASLRSRAHCLFSTRDHVTG